MCDVREQGANPVICPFLLLLPQIEFYTHLYNVATYHRILSHKFNENQPFFEGQGSNYSECPPLSGVSPSATNKGGLPQAIVAAFSWHKVAEDDVESSSWSHFRH
jgi:hypothetical protein